MKFSIFLSFVLLFGGHVNAQNSSFVVSGKISASNDVSDKFAVSLMSGKDSSLIKTVLTEKGGGYRFEHVSNGSYFVQTSISGFKKYSSSAFSVDNKDVQVATIVLVAESKILSGVNVTGKKPMFEMKADKLVVNVEASATNAGSSALEVLEKSPGITVDKDGNISLKGKPGVVVYLDGKPSYLSGSDLANMLKGMNSSQLDQIEIMTTPPAKYDAAGNAGVINIKTKKLKAKGFNGNVNLGYGQGIYHQNNETVSLNYKNDKINLYGSLNNNYKSDFQDFYDDRDVYGPNQVLQSNFKEFAYIPFTQSSNSIKLGIDYDFSKRTSASIGFAGRYSNLSFLTDVQNTIYDGKNNFLMTNQGNNYTYPKLATNTYSANIRHQFDSVGTEINVDGSYVRFTDLPSEKFFSQFWDVHNQPLSKRDSVYATLPNGYDIYALKADFTKSLSKKVRLESGFKFSEVKSDNDSKFDSIVNGDRKPDLNRSNHFKYDEAIYAGYINLNFPLSKTLKVQSGLRYEQTSGSGKSITNGTVISKRYGQLFPTLYLSYDLNKNNSFSFSYGRRINRPRYRDLNPYIFIVEKYSQEKGNPTLDPEFSHNIELSHVFKGNLSTTLNYTQTKGIISQVIEYNGDSKISTFINRNISSYNQIGIMVNYSKTLRKWLTYSGSLNIFRNKYSGINDAEYFNKAMNSAHLTSSVDIVLKKGWGVNIQGDYNSKSLNGFYEFGSYKIISFAVSKTILKGNGKFIINFNDPLYIQQFVGIMKLNAYSDAFHMSQDSRFVNVSFNYKFGKQFKTKAKRESSSSDEMKRVG